MTFSNFLTGFQAMRDRDPIVLLLIAAVALSALFLLSLGQPKTKGLRDGEVAAVDYETQIGDPAMPLPVDRARGRTRASVEPSLPVYRIGTEDPVSAALRRNAIRAAGHSSAVRAAKAPSECTGVSQDSDLQTTRGVEIADSRNTPPHRPALRFVNWQGCS